MLDALVSVEVQLSQIERVLLVAFLQHIRSKVGYEETEAWCEVVGKSDLFRKFGKFNIFAVMWEDAWTEMIKRMEHDKNF